MTKLQDFREQHPQYADLSDDDLVNGLHARYYSDLDVNEFRSQMGINAEPEPPEQSPGFFQRVKQKFAGDKEDTNQILNDDGKPDLIEATEPPEERALYRDQFFAGYDEYRANRALAKSYNVIQESIDAEDFERGQKDQLGGGILGVSASTIMRQDRATRADLGSINAQVDIADAVSRRRRKLTNILQESIDNRAMLLGRAETVPYSQASREMLQAEGFGESLSQLADDPIGIIAEVGLRSLPNMAEAVPLATLGAITGGVPGLAVGSGVGAATVEYRASFGDYLQEQGVDLQDAGALMAAAENDELMAGAHKFAMTRSSIIGAASTLSGGVATKTLTPFVKNAVGQQLANVGAQVVVQGGIEGAGEAVAQKVTTGKVSAGEVLAEGLGGAIAAPVDVGIATVTGVKTQIAERKSAKIQAELKGMLEQSTSEPTNAPRETPEEDAQSAASDVDPKAEVDFDIGQPFFDQRMEKRSYRDELEVMADSLVEGGGIALVTDENDVIVGRTPSVNPEWFKAMNLEDNLQMSTKQVESAVVKALRGDQLGVREERVLGYMLDDVRMRRDDAAVDLRNQLEDARQQRKLVDQATPENAGELYDETEYTPDMTADSRMIFELMTQAEQLGVTEDVLERAAVRFDDNQALMSELQRLIDETGNTQGTAVSAPQQVEQAGTADKGPERGADRRQSDQGPPDGQTDRRTGLERRAERVAQLTPEEITAQLYTDPMTGIGNRRAFTEEAADFDALVLVDVDSLKWVNDNLGHDAGDAMLISVGEAIDQADVSAFHISGDEFYIAGDSMEQVVAAAEMAKGVLAGKTIRAPKGQLDGVNITYGAGVDTKSADQALNEQKSRREVEGKRSGRGQVAKGAVLSVRNSQVLNMSPGKNHVPILTRTAGALPIDANNNLVLGNGRKVRIPEVPVRREHVIALMEKHMGQKIFQGRVRGKYRLGFYRPKHGELRIKDANDAEVAAHEIAHWIDDRYPAVAKLYESFDAEMRGVSYDSKLLHEGFAEFMRLYFSHESLAIKAAPGFYDAWQGFLNDHKPLQKAVFDMQELLHAWMHQGARSRLASKVGTDKPSIMERMLGSVDDSMLQSALDALRSVKKAELELNGDVETVAYNKLRLATGGANGVLEAVMFFGTPGWREDGQGLEYTGSSLKGVFGEHWGSQDLALYMVARRGKELMGQGRENLLTADEIKAGIDLGEQNPEFAKIFDDYQALNDRMLDFAEGAGILGAKNRALFQAVNQNYVPFHRIVNTLIGQKDNSQGGNPFQRLSGGTANINNIWDNIINNNGLMIRSALLNDGKRTLLQMLDAQNADKVEHQVAGKYAAPISTDVAPVSIESSQVVKVVLEALEMDPADYRFAKEGMGSEEQIAAAELVDELSRNLGDYSQFWQMGLAPTGAVDFYMDNGKKNWFEINDAGLWDSLQWLGPKPTNLALNILGGFSTALRRGVVSVPVFQVKNFVRDTANAWLLSDHVKVPAARALKVVFSRLNKDPAYQEMLINGGGFSNRSQGLQAQQKLIINPTRLAATYDRFMGRFENANRLAEYKAAREAGDSPRRASMLSREVSTDFSMRGSSVIARFLSISVPFLNARVQGNYRIVRQFTRPQAALSYAMRGAAVAAATLALYSLNRDDERYEEMPDDVRDLYWVFFTGEGEDDYFLLPKPFESGMLFGTIPERMMEYTREEDGKQFADAMGWMLLQTFHMDMTPQIFQPELDLQRNRNFAGSPIIPFYLDGVDANQQFMHYTSETAREAGKMFGISPIKLEYRIRGYFGTLGTYSLAMSDAMLRAASDPAESEFGVKPSRGETWRENLVVRSLIDPLVNEGPPRRTKYVQDLYEMVKEVEQTSKTATLLTRRRTEEIESYFDDPENQQQIAVREALQSVRKQINEIRQQMDTVRSSPDLDEDQKRVQIWELTRARNELAKQAVIAIDSAASAR